MEREKNAHFLGIAGPESRCEGASKRAVAVFNIEKRRTCHVPSLVEQDGVPALQNVQQPIKTNNDGS